MCIILHILVDIYSLFITILSLNVESFPLLKRNKINTLIFNNNTVHSVGIVQKGNNKDQFWYPNGESFAGFLSVQCTTRLHTQKPKRQDEDFTPVKLLTLIFPTKHSSCLDLQISYLPLSLQG